MMSRILLVLFLLPLGSGQQVNDLCKEQHMGPSHVVKRWPFYTRNETLDDSSVQDGHYVATYFGSPLDYPPGVGRCGGKYPIWMKEQKKDSAVMCVQNEKSTCFKEFEVKHQDCGHFSVYELRTEVKESVFCLQPQFCMQSGYVCGNGGLCKNERDGVSCQCPDGYSGPTCEGDPCSVSKPLPRNNSRLPYGWYSVPKGMKMLKRPPSVSGCGSQYPLWSEVSLGHSELICTESEDLPCFSPHIIMTKTCADTRVFTKSYTLSQCFECRPGPLDILVIEDVSSSVMKSDYQKMKDFILDNIRVLNISRGDNNVAFLSFANTAKVGFHLNTHSNTMDVVEAIASAHGEGGGTLVSSALELSASDVFTYHNGDRADADNIVVLFTDGRFKDETSLEQDIETLKARAEIYVVTVGPVVSNTTLVEMATTLDHILKLGDPSTANVITSALNPDPTCGGEPQIMYSEDGP